MKCLKKVKQFVYEEYSAQLIQEDTKILLKKTTYKHKNTLSVAILPKQSAVGNTNSFFGAYFTMKESFLMFL